MMRPAFGLALVVFAFCFAVSGNSQTNSQTNNTVVVSAPRDGNVTEWMSGEHIPAVAGLPFSAKVVLETVSQLQDGTQITHTTYNIDARDLAGRTRNEMRNWIPADGAEPCLTRIELYDPATRMRTDLFPLTKFARQWSTVATQTLTPTTRAVKPETTRVQIGTDTMEGLPVRGTRISQTYATGALGNDRPLTIVTEYWFSAELRINLLTKRTDPRHGVATVRVTEMVREEPDAALFAIGDEYKVVNDATAVPVVQGPGGSDERVAAGAASTINLAGNSALSGIARPGVNGVTIPRCTYCPNPSFSDEARAAKVQGTVILQVVVAADGRAENISVVRKAGYGLDQKAIEAVRSWQFKPATGPDGVAVATVVPIEVTFRLK
jgi:TonB family protein